MRAPALAPDCARRQTGRIDWSAPTAQTAAEVLGWESRHGVISAYVIIDAADRRGGWRIELREGLRAAVAEAAAQGREQERGARVAAERIQAELLNGSQGISGRGVVVFVEATADDPRESWHSAQFPPRRTELTWGLRPRVGPLLAMLDDGASRGVAVVSAERVRLLQWNLGRLSEISDSELDRSDQSWRERKAPRSCDPAAAQVISSAGRDQHEQRLESNRERFARDCGSAARGEASDWRELLVFGDERYVSRFSQGFDRACELRHIDGSDLVTVPSPAIAERVEGLLPGLNRERERSLLEAVRAAALTGARGALGPAATVEALEAGRVEHLLLDSTLVGAEPEAMVQRAIETGAAVTPIEGEVAAELADHGGVAALLRY